MVIYTLFRKTVPIETETLVEEFIGSQYISPASTATINYSTHQVNF